MFRMRRMHDQLGLGALRLGGMLPSPVCARQVARQLVLDKGFITVPRRALCNWTQSILEEIGGSRQ